MVWATLAQLCKKPIAVLCEFLVEFSCLFLYVLCVHVYVGMLCVLVYWPVCISALVCLCVYVLCVYCMYCVCMCMLVCYVCVSVLACVY